MECAAGHQHNANQTHRQRPAHIAHEYLLRCSAQFACCTSDEKWRKSAHTGTTLYAHMSGAFNIGVLQHKVMFKEGTLQSAIWAQSTLVVDDICCACTDVAHAFYVIAAVCAAASVSDALLIMTNTYVTGRPAHTSLTACLAPLLCVKEQGVTSMSKSRPSPRS